MNPETHSPDGNPHPQIILDYIKAYKAAYPLNTKPVSFVWSRRNGWITLNNRSVRPSDVVHATEKLKRRASNH